MRPLRGKAKAVGSKKQLRVDLDGVSVFLAMPVHRDLPIQTVHSLLETQSTAISVGLRCHIHFEIGCALVEVSRSACVHNFLKTEYTKMFWIDSDMQWSADDFLRTVAMSTEMKAICGSYPLRSEPLRFQLNTLGEKTVPMNKWDCIPCESGGLGFSIIDREIIEKLAANAPLSKAPPGNMEGQPMRHIFRCGLRNGEITGEDILFFDDIRALGYEVWCDPHIHLGHVGSKVYGGESFYEHVMAAKHRQVAAE
jgi:hypothetical protein